MSEPNRLSDTSADPLLRELLASGRDDQPSDAARRSAALAIGVAAGLATTAAAGGATAAGAATGAVAASKWVGTAAILKLVAVAAVGSAVVAGAVHERRRWSPAASPPDTRSAEVAPLRAKGRTQASVVASALPAAPEIASPSALAPASSPSAPPAPPATSAEARERVALVRSVHPAKRPSTVPTSADSPARASVLPSAPPASAPPPALVASATPSQVALPVPVPVSVSALPAIAPYGAELRDEVQRLDHARATLGAKRASAALTELNAYERAFPRGALGDEAEMLRIECLAEAGDVADAKMRAERLLARDGRGPYARRVRTLLASLAVAEGGH